MQKTSSRSEAQILENYRVALANVETQEELAQNLADFGYDPTLIEQGKQLLESTRQAFDFNKKEDKETREARADFEAKMEMIAKNYALHRKKAKVVFRNDPIILNNLALTGAVPRAYIKCLETMKTFYYGLHNSPSLQNRLLFLKIDADEINAALNNIAAVEEARNAYLIEMGESQDATKAKDAAFAKVDDWMCDFYAVAKIAMEDKPQLLEALGLRVKS